MIDTDRVLYFGCWGETGHYLRDRHQQHIDRGQAPWIPLFAAQRIDGMFLRALVISLGGTP